MSPSGPVGYFLIDSLDSLLLTGLEDEYKRARDWVAAVSFRLDDKFHTFEVRRGVLALRPGRVVLGPTALARNAPWLISDCSRADHDPRPRGLALGVPPLGRDGPDAPRQGRRPRRPSPPRIRHGARALLPLLLPARCYRERSCSRPRTAALGPPDELRQPRAAPRHPRRRQQRPDERRRGRVRPPFPSPDSASALARAVQF